MINNNNIIAATFNYLSVGRTATGEGEGRFTEAVRSQQLLRKMSLLLLLACCSHSDLVRRGCRNPVPSCTFNVRLIPMPCVINIHINIHVGIHYNMIDHDIIKHKITICMYVIVQRSISF